MAHYAFLDKNNIVTEVITGIDETELIEGFEPEMWYGQFRGQRCVRTSYNSNIRGHYAGIGDEYDEYLDLFISPKPFPSWTMTADGHWEAPTPRPTEGGPYAWNEKKQEWALVE